MRNALHYMHVNIPSPAFPSSDLTGKTFRHKSTPPGPPKGSGKHRYVFLLFRQQSPIDTGKLPAYEGISGRGGKKVAEVVDLLKDAGGGEMELMAVNWYEAEWDENVDKRMYERFGWKIYPLRWLLWFLI